MRRLSLASHMVMSYRLLIPLFAACALSSCAFLVRESSGGTADPIGQGGQGEEEGEGEGEEEEDGEEEGEALSDFQGEERAPGLLVATPSTLVLPLGSGAAVEVRLFDGVVTRALTPAESAAVVITASPASGIVVVDGFTVEALGTGDAVLRVDDHIHGADNVVVQVVPPSEYDEDLIVAIEPSLCCVSGAVGSTVALPTLVMVNAAGDTLPFDFDVLELVLDNGGVGTMTGTGSVQINTAGTAILYATRSADGVAVNGDVTVVGYSGGSGSNFADLTCDDPPVFSGCRLADYPVAFGSPGLSGALEIYRFFLHPDCLAAQIFDRSSPEVVVVSRPNVLVAGGPGAVTSATPGWTRVTVKSGGMVCGDFFAYVFPDISGTWTAQCSNDDVGQIQFSDYVWPPINGVTIHHVLSPYAGSAPGTGQWLQQSSFGSCFANDDEGFSCGNTLQQYRGEFTADGRFSPGVGYECGASRHGGASNIYNPDGSFTAGACTYTRGNGDAGVCTTSCTGRCCEAQNNDCHGEGDSCYCDEFCLEVGDCCEDYTSACGAPE